MTPEQQAAYVIAQAACLMAEVAGMQAENQWRVQNGNSLAYGEDAFQQVIQKYGVHHNGTIGLFTGRARG